MGIDEAIAKVERIKQARVRAAPRIAQELLAHLKAELDAGRYPDGSQPSAKDKEPLKGASSMVTVSVSGSTIQFHSTGNGKHKKSIVPQSLTPAMRAIVKRILEEELEK